MCVFHPRDSNYLLLSSDPEMITQFYLNTNTIDQNIPDKHKHNSEYVQDFCDFSDMIISAGEDEICLWKRGNPIQFKQHLEINNIGWIDTLVPEEE